MSTEIKSGKEILDEFFEEVGTDEKLDENTAAAIIDLYESDKLTDNNLTNKLTELREGENDGKDK